MFFFRTVEAFVGFYADKHLAPGCFFHGFDSRLRDHAYYQLITAELPFVTVVNRELLDSIRYEEVAPNYGVYWG